MFLSTKNPHFLLRINVSLSVKGETGVEPLLFGVMQLTSTERFWSKVDIRGDNECWPWLAGRDQNDYGEFWCHGRLHKANRIALMLKLCRELLPGMMALHTCDNPICCNPAHLYEGTRLDNVRDAVRRGRMVSKLTARQARFAKVLLVFGQMGPTDIARMLGVRPSTIWNIANQRTWRHV